MPVLPIEAFVDTKQLFSSSKIDEFFENLSQKNIGAVSRTDIFYFSFAIKHLFLKVSSRKSNIHKNYTNNIYSDSKFALFVPEKVDLKHRSNDSIAFLKWKTDIYVSMPIYGGYICCLLQKSASKFYSKHSDAISQFYDNEYLSSSLSEIYENDKNFPEFKPPTFSKNSLSITAAPLPSPDTGIFPSNKHIISAVFHYIVYTGLDKKNHTLEKTYLHVANQVIDFYSKNNKQTTIKIQVARLVKKVHEQYKDYQRNRTPAFLENLPKLFECQTNTTSGEALVPESNQLLLDAEVQRAIPTRARMEAANRQAEKIQKEKEKQAKIIEQQRKL